jgi:hypothetical protein
VIPLGLESRCAGIGKVAGHDIELDDLVLTCFCNITDSESHGSSLTCPAASIVLYLFYPVSFCFVFYSGLMQRTCQSSAMDGIRAVKRRFNSDGLKLERLDRTGKGALPP